MKNRTKLTMMALAFSWMPWLLHADEVDLELLLAVDVSGSVSQSEFELQLRGIAAAFRDPEVHDAIRLGPNQKIAVALMIWADAPSRKASSDWIIVDSPLSAEIFAQTVLSQVSRRKSFLGRSGTGIGAAIGHGVQLLRRNGIEGIRRTIDVSGDGHETPLAFGEGMALPEAHRRARRADVTVNGLAILSDDTNLLTYYRARVIRGPGSFAVAATDYSDFARAMKSKLLREIPAAISMVPDGQQPAREDYLLDVAVIAGEPVRAEIRSKTSAHLWEE